MKSRRFAIVAVTALAAVGAGAAFAATQDDKGKEAENAVLSDAAERLDVSSDELRTALSEAQQAQLDKAVEDGDLTQAQADKIKQHMEESGRVLGFPGGPGGPGGPRGHHGPGRPGGGPPFFDAIAKELGISEQKLHNQLHRGRSLAQIAKANGKTVDELKAVAKAAIEKQLAQDVEAGRITQAQADEMKEHIPEMLERLGKRPRLRDGGPPHGGPGGFGGPGGPPPMVR